MKRLLAIPFMLFMALSVVGQQQIRLTDTKKGRNNQLTVENYAVTRAQQKTIVTMDFVLDSLRVPSNRYRAFTPIIRSSDGTQQQRLKTLIVSGRTQDIIFERDGIDPLYADNCDNIRRQNGQPQRYSYTDAVPAQPWHNGADVYVECDLCGCGDTLKSELAHLGTLLPPDPYGLVDIVDVVPAPDDKIRELHGTAYITFVVDRWEMKPDYMNNRRELRKITDTLDIMVADPTIEVERIKIHGWASPESPYDHNRMLATNRAKSLTEYVKNLYRLDASKFAPAEATPENWIGLRAAVEGMDLQTLPHKKEILAIIGDNTIEPDPKEWKIKRLYPAEYRYLLTYVYPGLRRSDYEITFKISKFTTEQAVQVYQEAPYKLSLHELWNVANTFEPYSDDYNRVMQTAVNLYPDSTVAMINLANVAMRQHDLLKAETLLQRAGDSKEADGARAVLYILQQRYDEAEKALDRAAAKGLDVTKNRQALSLLTK